MSLEVTREQHTSVEAHELCLEALSTDLRNLRPRQISFALIEAPSGRLIHSISSPLHVRLSRTPGRADETLEIESQGGLRTRLSSSTTALPERFDPISVEELVDL